jgi:cell division protease FtsH
MGGGPEGMGHRVMGAVNRATLKATGVFYPQIEQMFMGGGMGGGSGALTRLLVAMDGMEEPTRWEKIRNKIYNLIGKDIPARDWHVLYMGATNRPDVLDPALTRPGRFDRLLEVGPPDKAGRREIINYYLKKVKHDGNIDVEAIVNDTTGYTPAQLMSAITKGSVRIAVFDNRNYIKQSDIDRALMEQSGGMENPIEEMPESQRRQIAYHEAGHAVSVFYLAPHKRMTRATIVRHGRSLGHVGWVYEEDQHAQPLSQIVNDIRVSMAGQAATKVFMGELWTGASGGDYPNIRRRLWGLAAEGFFGPPVTDPGQTLARGTFEGEMFDQLWQRVERFWQETEEEVGVFLLEHKGEVEAVAEALLEHETLMGIELREIIELAGREMENRPVESVLPTPEIEDLRQPVDRAAAEPAPEPTPGDK